MQTSLGGVSFIYHGWWLIVRWTFYITAQCTCAVEKAEMSPTKQYLLILFYFMTSFLRNGGHDPENWFHDPQAKKKNHHKTFSISTAIFSICSSPSPLDYNEKIALISQMLPMLPILLFPGPSRGSSPVLAPKALIIHVLPSPSSQHSLQSLNQELWWFPRLVSERYSWNPKAIEKL